MASSSIFIYELRSPAEMNVESIYSRLKGYPEDENTYFNLEMISANELLGEYVIVQNAQIVFITLSREFLNIVLFLKQMLFLSALRMIFWKFGETKLRQTN